MLFFICGAIIIFFVLCIFALLVEFIFYKKNPIALMINHDKRFEEIGNESLYLHKVFDIKRGN